MTIKYELLKKLVVAAGLKKRWPSVTTEELLEDRRKQNAKNRIPALMENVLPVMCNCDHLAMQKLHACLIREGTCVESPCCDYCIVGERHPLAQEYDLVKKENGLLVSVKK
ncbi:MAG: hypothetical protein ACSW79_01285 [Eubacteriales bacterium]